MSLKKVLALSLFILVLLCGAACAEGLSWFDESRLDLNLPAGMKAEYSYSDGHLEIEIDSAATDWGQTLIAIYNSELQCAYYSPILKAPSGATHMVGFGCSADAMTDAEILEQLTYEYPNEGDTYTNGNEIGSYLESSGLFQPREETNQMMVVQWQDASGNIVASEKLRISITYTSTNPISVEIPRIPASQLIPAPDLTDAERALANISVGNGSLRYRMQQANQYVQLRTYVACPDANATENGGWKCITFMYGDSMENEPYYVEVDGATVLAVEVAGRHLNCAQEESETLSMTVQWINPDGECVQSGVLDIVYVVGDEKVWPSYVEEWEPVSSNQIAQIETINAVEGLSATYDGGILTMGVEDDKIPSGAALGSVQFTVKVTPPEGAVYYRSNRSGGNDIFGEDPSQMEDQDRIVQDSDLQTISKNPFTLEIFPCTAYESKDLNLTVYLTGDISTEFGGSVNLVYWYDAYEDIISRQWIVERYEPIERVEQTPAYEDDESIEGVLRLPVIVVYEDGASEKYTLVITMYPQDGEDSIYYELHLEDRDGDSVELPGRCRLYVPYPDGHDRHSHKKYRIRHYDKDHNQKELFEDNITRTEHGLCIEVSSLSPFVLSWEDMEIVSITLPADLAEIGEEAFSGTDFEGVVIPEGCTSIGNCAFGNMPNLLEVQIPESVTSIDETAFQGSGNVVLSVTEGSYAHSFAVDNGYNYSVE